MKKTIYICDRCGKEIKDGVWLKLIAGTASAECDFIEECPGSPFDLCEKCEKELKAFLRPPAKEKPEKKKQIDKAKIWNLHKHGWAADRIAIDSHISRDKVLAIIKEAEKAATHED